MSLFSRSGLIVVGLSVLGIITHLLPHSMGVSTVGAIGMLAAAYLPRFLLLIPVLVTVLVADLMLGGYAWQAMLFVYLAHGLAAFSLVPLLRHVRFVSVVFAGVLSAFIFYLVSNITPMAMGYYLSLIHI